MKKEYSLNFSGPFLKKAKKLMKKNPNIKRELDKTTSILRIDPFFPSLKTHKANTPLHALAYTSRLNKDYRIIWKFDDEVATILDILDIGGHSGSKKVYK